MSDYPDNFGQQIFAREGALSVSSFVGNAQASAEKTLITVSKKGVIHGGDITIVGTADQGADILKYYIDDTLIGSTNINSLLSEGFAYGSTTIWRLLKYDSIAFEYTIAFMGKYTLDSGFKLTYTETYGRTPALNVDILYSSIQ